MPAQTSGDRTLRSVAPDPEVYAWLWSEEGQLWCTKNFQRVRHAYGSFAEIKNDHECMTPSVCTVNAYAPYSDHQIRTDIRAHGINGVPEEWKKSSRRC